MKPHPFAILLGRTRAKAAVAFHGRVSSDMWRQHEKLQDGDTLLAAKMAESKLSDAVDACAALAFMYLEAQCGEES